MAKPPGVRIEPGGQDIELLPDPVLIPAHIRGDDRVFRQCLAGIRQNTLRHHRERGRGLHLGVRGFERGAELGNLGLLLGAREAVGIHFFCNPCQHAQSSFGIGNYTDLGRIVAADLLRLDVDMNDLRCVVLPTDIERVARIPAGAIGLFKAGPHGEDIVRIQAGLVHQLGAPEARHAHDQRVIITHCALAHQGNAQPAAPYARQTHATLRWPAPTKCRRPT